MKEAGFDRGLKILFLCFFVFVIVALIVWTSLPSEWMKFLFIIFVVAFLCLFAFIVRVYIEFIGYVRIFGQTIEIDDCKSEITEGRKIEDWKENWRLFLIVFTVGVFCFFILFSPTIMPRLSHNLITNLLMWTVVWIQLQGYWAYRKYRSGKIKKAVRMLCRAKYKNDGTFYSCLEEQAWRCRRIIDYTGASAQGGLGHSINTIPVYEPIEETKGMLEAYVRVNYDSWREKYAGQDLKAGKEKAGKEKAGEESIQIPSREERKQIRKEAKKKEKNKVNFW